ncbi:MAG TPA: hypothetical protein VLA62_08000 [Solirubrobacterales bacterium]|nr:hypothetical protein [Solirubrobacterales bacterium]
MARLLIVDDDLNLLEVVREFLAMNGLQVVRAPRAPRPRLPILAMSGGGTDVPIGPLPIAGKLGATRVVEKPFDLQATFRIASHGVMAAARAATSPLVGSDRSSHHSTSSSAFASLRSAVPKPSVNPP